MKNLIAINGGVIDDEGDENGKETGKITADTDYLILGEQPNEKGDQKEMGVYGRMRADADRLHVRVLSLAELKQQMGYHTELTAKKYGAMTPTPRSGNGSKPAAEKPAPTEEKAPESGE